MPTACGGSVEQAARVTGEFLPRGALVYTAEGAKEGEHAHLGVGMPWGSLAVAGLVGWFSLDAFDSLFSNIDSTVGGFDFDGGALLLLSDLRGEYSVTRSESGVFLQWGGTP